MQVLGGANERLRPAEGLPAFVPVAARDGQTLRNNRYCSFQLFPGCQLIQHDDLLILARIVPTGAQSCRFIAHYLVERDADLGRVEAWIALWNRTYDEDAGAVERQHRGLCSGRVPRLRYVPAREKPALFINGLIREACRGFKDVVNTALVDAKHSKSAVLHTLVGNKYGEGDS